MDGAVNKRDLSTGETGELVRENVGFGPKRGVELTPQGVSSPAGEAARRARTFGMWRMRSNRSLSAAAKIMGV